MLPNTYWRNILYSLLSIITILIVYFQELQRTLDHDEKLKDFLFHKSNDRAFASDFGEDEKGKKRIIIEARQPRVSQSEIVML